MRLTTTWQSLSSIAVRRIHKELLFLRKSPPAGVQSVENEDNDITIINVTLDGPGYSVRLSALTVRGNAF